MSAESFSVYINGLPAATSLGPTDQLYVRQGGVSKQIPGSAFAGGGGGGNVNGPGASTVGHFALWNNTTGTLLSDGGAPAASATIDTTNAGNISSGTLAAARLPTFGSGDVSFASGGGAGTIAASAVTNAKMANMPASTIKGNVTTGSASPTDFTIDGLTLKATPAAGDELIIWDVAGAAIKKATVSSVGGGGGTPGGASLTLQYNNAGAFGGMSGTSWDDTNRSLTTTGATVTANHPILDMTQTWNNAAVAFTGLRANYTVTASNNAGFFFMLQRGGSSVFSVSEFGSVNDWGSAQDSTNSVFMDSNGFHTKSAGYFGFTSGGAGQASDTRLTRVVAGVTEFASAAGLHDQWYQWGGQARVTSDFTVTSSTALTAVTGLAVPLAAGRTYSFEADLSWTDAAAGGIQAAMTATGGLTATNIIYDGWIIDSAANGIKGNAQATALGTAVANSTTTGTAGHLTISGTITVNVAGTLNVAIAQNTSNGTATTIKRGSRLLVYDMP